MNGAQYKMMSTIVQSKKILIDIIADALSNIKLVVVSLSYSSDSVT